MLKSTELLLQTAVLSGHEEVLQSLLSSVREAGPSHWEILWFLRTRFLST